MPSPVSELIQEATRKMLPKRVDKPGVYPDLSPADYHADPCVEPSLSASIACSLVFQTPLHAWAKHPRLNEAWREQLGLDEADSDRKRELGSVAHELLLGRGQGIHIIQAAGKDGAPVTDYRTCIREGAISACVS